MLRKTFYLLIVGVVLMAGAASAQGKKTGLVLRGSYQTPQGKTFSVSTYNGVEEIGTGRGGGWLTVYSRMSDRSFLEFSIGGLGDVEVHSQYFDEDEVAVDGMTPITLGLRYHLLPLDNSSALQPYVGLGGGPYWVSAVQVRDDNLGAEVAVKSELFAGFYACTGFDFMLLNWLGLNLDFKYHLVNLDPDHNCSGMEAGFGLVFRWGRYQDGR